MLYFERVNPVINSMPYNYIGMLFKTVIQYAQDSGLIIVCKTASVTNSRHYMTVRTVLLNGSSNKDTINGTTIATASQHWKASSNGTLSSRGGTTAYGVYPNSCSVSSGTATIEFYQRYNSTSTGTINGNYTAYIYGFKFEE